METEEKFKKLKEAFEEAVFRAEGYSSNMRIPIFYNNKGEYYYLGKIQNQSWNDILDDESEEVGGVEGWSVDYYDFDFDGLELDREEEIQEILNQDGERWFEDFCERYEI